MPSKLTQEQFIEKAKQVHNNVYDYNLVEYKHSKTKVKIICPIHGIFEQLPIVHINQKSGCPKCKWGTLNTKSFIIKANIIHNNKFDYSLVEYFNNLIKVKIICPIHGVFEQSPDKHLSGQECPKCAGKNISTPEIKTRFIKIHGNKYDYSLVEYNGYYIPIKIICPKHGIFEQLPSIHLKGCGCQKCKQSKGENKIEQWLLNNNIKFINQHTFYKCENVIKLRFDFYLPDYNICIEFDGEQHYKGWWKFSNNDKLKRIQSLEKIKESDDIKTKFCLDNGIKLIRIPYWEYNKIDEILSNMISI